jgi:hypothetical protein
MREDCHELSIVCCDLRGFTAFASGMVTVGVIDGEGRLEYAAVGQPVNLASRLCD